MMLVKRMHEENINNSMANEQDCPTCLIERSEEDEMKRKRQSILDQRKALDLQIKLRESAVANQVPGTSSLSSLPHDDYDEIVIEEKLAKEKLEEQRLRQQEILARLVRRQEKLDLEREQDRILLEYALAEEKDRARE